MSFKRDGNDSGLLKNLQHRRVSEILGDYIPEDEALLLSNGRLTCTICPKRPIFDTIQMLSLHRKGKNHLYELSCYLQHKRNLEYKKCEVMQKKLMKTTRTTTTAAAAANVASRDAAVPYLSHSLTRARKRFGWSRKQVLDVAQASVTTSLPAEQSANSQVRHYLKGLVRKRPLEKVVDALRANYGVRQSPGEGRGRPPGNGRDARDATARSISEANLKILESGWIKDDDGKWVKDPNVEFDSDEEEPPPNST